MIRTLLSEDVAKMAIIHKHSFPVGWPEDDMVRHIEKELCLGVGDPLEAFILVQIGGDQADILTIATDPAHRRQGHARLLIRATEGALKAQNVNTLYLDVLEINEAAIALYKSCGFQPIGRRPAYYRTPKGRVASITFSKSLP